MFKTNYCTVKQNMGMISEDSPGDDDRLPDFTNISGKVIFTPTTAPGHAYQVIGEGGEAYTVPVASVEADIIDGRIFHEGQEGILLFAAGDNATPDRIVYRVTYSGLRAGGVPVNLSTIFFEAVPGAVIDLTRVTPVPGAPVAGTVKGDKGDPGPKGDKGDKGEKGDAGYSGVGSPEGVVAAPVGSIYTDTAATIGAIRWIKTSGTGNTGWAVEYGDTGWRDATQRYLDMQAPTGNVLTLGEGARILARRTTSTLTYAFEGPISVSRAWSNLFQPPKGFRPEYDMGIGFATKGRLEGNGMFIRLMGLDAGSFVDAGRVLSVTFPMSPNNWPITSIGDPA